MSKIKTTQNHDSPSTLQRRTIFGFARKAQRQPKTADLDPGLGKMLQLSVLSKVNARPPPAADLVIAFNAFFRARQKTKEPLLEIQARHVLRTFEYLQETNRAQEAFGLTPDDLQVAREALIYMPQDNVETHNHLSRALFEEVKRRKEADPSIGLAAGPEALLPHIRVLSQTGDSIEARALVEQSWRSDPGRTGRRVWVEVLDGLAKENNEKELLQTIAMMERSGIPFDAKLHQVMTVYYAHMDNFNATKKWYEHAIADGKAPTDITNSQILKFCIRNGQLDWGRKVFHSILEGNPDKRTWDIIFQWAAALGKGVDEIDRMMDVMIRRNEGDDSVRPDIETINNLVEFANSRIDPYTAERYISMGQKRGMIPNAQTYVLQMDYRISVGDIDGAKASYDRLQGEEVHGDEDLVVVNRLIRALCAAPHPSHNAIATMVSDVEQRRARLDPDTVSRLSIMHLRREELIDLHDVLQTHTFHYSTSQRADIISVFVDFCLDRENEMALVWDAYSTLRQIFDETSVETRTRLMREFFERGRSDMACHVFGHMRQNIRPDGRPSVATYIECFKGITRAADLESLEMVHNMLKLDSSIEPTIQLYNALMQAYTATEMQYRSLEFWQDIIKSREGPSYASIVIALQACQSIPFGDRPAREIWTRVRSTDMQISREIGSAYLGALAGQGLLKEVVKATNSLMTDLGLQPDELM